MSPNGHRVPPVKLALLSSMPAKAPAGSTCGDCGKKKHRNGWPGWWGPTLSVPTAAFVASTSGSGGIGILFASIKQRLTSHRHHWKLAFSGWSAREARLVTRGSRGPPLCHWCQVRLPLQLCWRENRTSPPHAAHVTPRSVARRANQCDLLIDNGKILGIN
jgi:hypothetical protein